MNSEKQDEHTTNPYEMERNAFLKVEASLLPVPSKITELGAGESRSAEMLGRKRRLTLPSEFTDIRRW